jgi:predicted transcriptional regulator
MTKALKDVLARAENWPDWARQDLADLALEIDREVNAGTYRATRAELRKIDEALAAVRRGEVATHEEVEAVLAKYRAP